MTADKTITPRLADIATQTQVLDRHGRPCPVAAINGLMENHDSLKKARTLDSYALAHAIARGLTEQAARDESLGATLEVAREHVEMNDDVDPETLRGLLDLIVEFQRNSANKAFYLSGQVLAAIERGKLYE